NDVNQAVIDEAAADSLKVGLGDTFTMGTDSQKLALKVVGIVHKPDLIAAAVKSVYLPLGTLQKFASAEGNVSNISIDLHAGTRINDFLADWQKKLTAIDAAESAQRGSPVAALKLTMAAENRGELDRDLAIVNIISYMAGAVSMLAATFIIFSSLSMGVSERQRLLAMLRALGAQRSQVARLVIVEGLLLVAIGASIGAALGLGWIYSLEAMFPDFFTAGVMVSWGGMIFAVGTSLFAALAASLLPALEASRVSPLKAMAALSQPPRAKMPFVLGIVAVLLLAVDPIIFFVPWEQLVSRFYSVDPHGLTTLIQIYAHFIVGLPCLFAGFFLIAPLFVRFVETTCTSAVAWMFGLPEKLLRQQLSGGLWRAAGTGSALMVGLAVLIAMTTQGESLMSTWRLPDKFPDVFIVSQTWGGVSPKQQAELAKLPEIRHEPDGTPEVFPVAITISGMGSNPINLIVSALAPNMTNTFFFGAPPKISFDMIKLDFRDNDGKSVSPEQQQLYARRAENALADDSQRWVIVTEDYRRLHHAKYGDPITLEGPGGRKYVYHICGIVWSPGLDVVVSMFDLGRQLNQRTSGMVIGSFDAARRDFGVDNVNIFAANLIDGVDKEKVVHDLREKLGPQLNMKVGDIRQIKVEIDGAFHHMLALLSTVAFAALAVASLGVTNTVMAGIRTRRWLFGVLRSVGLERGSLLRLILAEAALLGFVGLALGLACGAEMAVDAHPLIASVAGLEVGMVVPWGYILIGAASVMLVSLGASLWPALTVSISEPLSLLQAGRAAT
ncbi:MAG TPA: FtsX-like permease family protein, partial [Tepidisphaeraceae bacterium]|nr:FtsX-like permease family protein [Tepidisphaeraceae bacterium]